MYLHFFIVARHYFITKRNIPSSRSQFLIWIFWIWITRCEICVGCRMSFRWMLTGRIKESKDESSSMILRCFFRNFSFGKCIHRKKKLNESKELWSMLSTFTWRALKFIDFSFKHLHFFFFFLILMHMLKKKQNL